MTKKLSYLKIYRVKKLVAKIEWIRIENQAVKARMPRARMPRARMPRSKAPVISISSATFI